MSWYSKSLGKYKKCESTTDSQGVYKEENIYQDQLFKILSKKGDFINCFYVCLKEKLYISTSPLRHETQIFTFSVF